MVSPATTHRPLHRKRGSVSGSRQPEDHHEIVEALAGATEILIVGPGQAKLELIKHIHSHDHAVSEKVIGVETVDQPGDAWLVAFARKYFVAKDRLPPQ